MVQQPESFSMLKDYLGIDKRKTAIFSALIVGVFVTVTSIYIAIYGFDTWSDNMKSAGSLMIVNLDAPLQNTPGVSTNIDRRVIQPIGLATTVQYFCSSCGLSGLPLWSNSGTPMCPTCGAVMTVTGN